MTERENLAWAAGFFDGEGSFTRAHGVRRVNSPYATITQVDRRVLERFREIVGVGAIYGPYRHGSLASRDQFVWRTGKFESVQHVVASLWTFLSPVKRAQAARVLTAYADQNLAHIKRLLVCPNGHAKVTRGDCVVCARASVSRWRAKNRDHINAYNRSRRVQS